MTSQKKDRILYAVIVGIAALAFFHTLGSGSTPQVETRDPAENNVVRTEPPRQTRAHEPYQVGPRVRALGGYVGFAGKQVTTLNPVFVCALPSSVNEATRGQRARTRASLPCACPHEAAEEVHRASEDDPKDLRDQPALGVARVHGYAARVKFGEIADCVFRRDRLEDHVE